MHAEFVARALSAAVEHKNKHACAGRLAAHGHIAVLNLPDLIADLAQPRDPTNI